MKNYTIFAFTLILVCAPNLSANAFSIHDGKGHFGKTMNNLEGNSRISSRNPIILAQHRSHRSKAKRHHRSHRRHIQRNYYIYDFLRTPKVIIRPRFKRYSYYMDSTSNQNYPSRCSYLLGYSQRRMLPPGWTVNEFNAEVSSCRTAYYPTFPEESIPQGSPLPQYPTPPSVPPSPSFYSDSKTCRLRAYQVAEGGIGLDKTIEGGLIGGALGAAAGAAIGAAAGDPGKGAAIGAAAGGFGGAVINNFEASQEYKAVFRNCMRNRGHEVLL
jgi:outer membrane lipoprotein SlyB